MLSFLFSLLALAAAVVPGLSQNIPADVRLSFTLQSLSAPWAARQGASVEVYRKALSFGGVTFPANSLVLFGGGSNTWYNDVWASSDQGRSWTLVSGLTSGRTTFPASVFPGYTIDSQQRLFKIAGIQNNSYTGDVYMSTNGGVSWTQQTPTNAATSLPGRNFPDVYVDSTDALYVIGGLIPTAGAPGSNDVWRSSDQGRNWYKQPNMPFPAPPGRSTGGLLHFASRQLGNRDVLTYMGGYGRPPITYYNDIYISTDRGAKWLTITLNAPWFARDNFNAEMTKDGVIVINAGFNDVGGDRNDVWISMDGGYTWGLCLEDAPFTDRRWQSTVLDDEGYFYVIGGDERNNNTGPRIMKNDVWRSTFSFNDLTALSKACNTPIPACGTGLTCVPGPNTRIVNGRVTCPAVEACSTDNLAFNPLVAMAAFPPRHSAGVELLRKAMRVGTTTFPVGSMVLYGGTGQGEALLTDTWITSNGANWVQVPSTSTFTGAAWSGHIVDSKSNIYKIAGERWGTGGQPNTVNSDVWMSSNAGLTWTRQLNTSRTTGLPRRAFADVYVDSTDTLYVMGGLSGDGLNDIWASSDQGKNWRLQGNLPVTAPPGRSSATLLINRSPALKKDIFYYFGGFGRGGAQQGGQYHNDVWVSSTAGKSWSRITDRAPWAERDNFQGEITKDGLIVFTAGYNSREALNDVWVSADGGWTWGQCVAEASFSDRRWQTTILDNAGFFYLMGGEEVEGGVYTKMNDVWKSSFSLTNKARVAKACKITYPACQATGLTCWPGSSTRVDNRGQITCPALTAYCNRGDESSSGDYGESSTGLAPEPSSGLSTGLIALIVVLVLAGVAAVGGYWYYSRKNAATGNVNLNLGTDNLLGAGSTDSGAASDYYAQASTQEGQSAAQ